jgi:hypothetical protein
MDTLAQEPVRQHGVAWDVHCCECHSGLHVERDERGRS